MSSVVTLSMRKRRETDRRRAAVELMEHELRAIARDCGGRILVFGSAATGALTDRSDLDLLVDVPDDAEAAVWSRIEDLARRFDIPADIHSVRTSRPSFVKRVTAAARVLA